MKRNKTTSKNTQTGAEQQQAALNGISLRQVGDSRSTQLTAR
jgi:hypothetical protein